MPVPFIDLKRSQAPREAAVREAVLRVLDHHRFILGSEVEAFESAMGEMVGAHVVGVSSGTDALLLGLMTLGIQAHDRVLTTPFSFFATAGVVRRLGAVPVFVDIELDTMMMDPELMDSGFGDVACAIPVHLFGDHLSVDDLRQRLPGVPILEDAAQALGVRPGGVHAGAAGEIGAFSFFPTKNLGALGDAGMAITRDAETAERMRRLRGHGQSSRYHHEEVGGNFRLDAIQAAALTASLEFLDGDTAARRSNAARYRAAFDSLDATEEEIILPVAASHHTYHQFVVRIPDGRRDAVQAGLTEAGVGSAVYYPIPFHRQPCFQDLGYKEGAFPNAEKACEEVLALPIFPGLTEGEIDEVAQSLMKVLRGA